MMKSIKCLYAASLLAIGSTAAMAQASYTDKDGNEYQFKRHWFLDIQAGGQYTVVRQASQTCFLLTSRVPSATSSLLFSDSVVRLMVSGARADGTDTRLPRTVLRIPPATNGNM